MSGETHDSEMDQQAVLPLGIEAGAQVSRFLPHGEIQAETLAGTNVASGALLIGQQHIHMHGVSGQPLSPPILLPRRTEHFQDRVSERSWLLAHLSPGRIITICGPGGMGKTALVAEILWTLALSDDLLKVFPHGIVFHSFYGRPETAVALEQLARTFGESPLPTPAQAAHRALSGKRALLVFDGAEEAENMEQVLSVCAGCAVIVTSRHRSDAADPAHMLDLRRLPLNDAIAVMQAWQAQGETNEAVIERICELVGGLPLALRLAGNYLGLHEEPTEYLEWLEENLFEALEQGTSSHKSIRILLDRSVSRLKPDTQEILGIIGLLALAPFEHELVASVLEVAPRVANRTLEELVDNGLLVRVGSTYEVSHPLIHSYAKEKMLTENELTNKQNLIKGLVLALNRLFPEEQHYYDKSREKLLAHIQACAAYIDQYGLIFIEAAQLFQKAGWYLQVVRRYTEAENFIKRSIAIYEKVVGSDHPMTANSLGILAMISQDQGKLVQAEMLLKRVLNIEERVFGIDHYETARTLSNLAILYQAQGNYVQAESLFKQAVAIKERVFGIDHYETAMTLSNLANFYQDQGNYVQAEQRYKQALAIREKVLGPEHPDTASIIRYLATLYRNQNNYEQAEQYYKRALAIYEKVLGPEHPATAAILSNLAILYQHRNDYAQAEQYYKQALAIYEKVLGPEHPDTATTLHGLAGFYRNQNDYVQAEQYYKQALAIYEKVLGPEHPYTATILYSLASFYRNQNNYEQAEQYYKQALAIREKVLGPEHLDTASVLYDLADLYKDQGNYKQAEQHYKQRLILSEELQNAEGIIVSLKALVNLTILEGDYIASNQYLKRVVELLTQQGDHKQATAVLFNAGQQIYEQLEKQEVLSTMNVAYQQARRYYERSLALGEGLINEAETITILDALVDVTIAEGDYAASNQYLERVIELLTQQGNHKRASVALFNKGLKIYEQLQKKNARPEEHEAYQQARRYYERSLTLGEGLISEAETITILDALVDVAIAEGDYAAADEYLEKVVALLTQQGNHKRVSVALFNKGLKIYEQLQTLNARSEMREVYQQARRYYERSLALGEGLISEAETITILDALVDVAIAEGDYAAADEYLEKVVALLTQQGNHKRMSLILFNAGREIYEQLQTLNARSEMREVYQQARRYYERSLALDEELQDEKGIIASLNALIDLTISEEDYVAADEYLEKVVEHHIQQGNKKLASAILFNVGQVINKHAERLEASDKNEEGDTDTDES